jgi:hypothetical protein
MQIQVLSLMLKSGAHDMAQDPETISPRKARQDNKRRPSLLVLIAGLIPTVIAWAGSEFWDERIERDAQPTASTKEEPIDMHSSAQGAFDDNPPTSSAKAPGAVQTILP